MEDIRWQLISEAEESIEIFTDEIVWVQRDNRTIRSKTKAGVRVAVLCRAPCKNTDSQASVRALLEAGAEVKFFDETKPPFRFGLITDASDAARGTVLQSESGSILRMIGFQDVGSKGHGFMRFTNQKDWRYIGVLSELFQLMWRQARDGVVLEPVEVEPLIRNKLPELLRLIPQYTRITQSDITFEPVDLDEMLSSSVYAKTPSLQSVASICYAYADQGIFEYKPCYCTSSRKSFLLLPPILEAHNDKFVVVDGVHRLFHLYALQQRSNASCLILRNTPELPGKPIPLPDVRMWPRRLPREQTFIGYDHSRFRSFRILEEKLTSGFADGD